MFEAQSTARKQSGILCASEVWSHCLTIIGVQCLVETLDSLSYGTAKAAMVGLMNVLRMEGEKYDIRVNVLAPTAATRMTAGLIPEHAMKLMTPESVYARCSLPCRRRCAVEGISVPAVVSSRATSSVKLKESICRRANAHRRLSQPALPSIEPLNGRVEAQRSRLCVSSTRRPRPPQLLTISRPGASQSGSRYRLHRPHPNRPSFSWRI